jgi:hypothetical protein
MGSSWMALEEKKGAAWGGMNGQDPKMGSATWGGVNRQNDKGIGPAWGSINNQDPNWAQKAGLEGPKIWSKSNSVSIIYIANIFLQCIVASVVLTSHDCALKGL